MHSAGQGSGPGKGQFFWNFKIEPNAGYNEWNYLLGLSRALGCGC